MLEILGTCAIVIAVVWIGRRIDRAHSLAPRPEELAGPARPRPASHGAGEAPATAIRAGAAQLERLRVAQRCHTCRGLMTPAQAEDERVRYGDKELIVIELRCPRCELRRALYVLPTAATPTTA